jgi:hypothetical protein
MQSPIRLRWVVLIVLTLFIAGDIVFRTPRHGDVDPVEAAKPRYIAEHNLELVLTADGPVDMIGCLRNCWFAGSSAAKLVLYRDTTDEEDRYHFGLLGQYGNEWYRTGEQSLPLTDPKNHDQSFSLMVGSYPAGASWMYRWGIVQDYTVTVGRVECGQVARVDLVYDSGEISSAWPDGEYFVNFAPASEVCEAFVVDHQGDVIESLGAGDWPGIGRVGPDGVMQPCE